MRKDGSSREALARELSAPLSVIVDDTSVYFGETGAAVGNPSMGLRRVAKGGGTVAHVSDTYFVAYMTQVGSDVLFAGAAEDAAGLFRLPKAGGVAQLLADDSYIEGTPRVAGNFVYWLTFPETAETDSLMRVPLTGGTPELLRFADSAESGFQVDDCGTYFGTFDAKLVKGPR